MGNREISYALASALASAPPLLGEYSIRSCKHEILPDIQPKGHHEVEDKRGAEGDERCIDKVHAYTGGFDPHPLADLLANTEGRLFEKMSFRIK